MQSPVQPAALLLLLLPLLANAGHLICNPSPLELVFAVDVSSSLSREDFANLKTFLKEMAESIPLGPKATQPAIVSFSTNVTIEANLGDVNNPASYKRVVDNIPYYRGFTATGMALRTIREQVLVRARPEASKLVVVVTDGRTNHPGSRLEALKILRTESAMLRTDGVRIHAVGVGGIWLEDELKEISGGDDYSMIDNYAKLIEIVEPLTKDICELHCKDVGKLVSIHGRCHNGTQQITHITKRHNKNKNRCEKVISRGFKYCGQSHRCKAIEVTIGDCVNGVRNIVTSWEEFDVTKQKCVLKTSVKKMDCKIIEECREPVGDVMFILDSSGSMSDRYWKLQVAFVHTLVQHMRVAPKNIRVGVVVFGTKAWTDIKLGYVTDKKKLLGKIKKLKRRRKQWTATGLGIQAARMQFKQRGRPGVRRLAVVMTDGASNRPPNAIEQAAQMENEGATILVIGVGSKLAHDELEGIATPPLSEHLFYAADFDKLVAWAGKISEETCESITPPAPSLCDLPPTRVISDCYKGVQKVTEIRYEFDSLGRCSQKLVSRVLTKCHLVCTDPINGNHYFEDETWSTNCMTFTCRRMPRPWMPLLPTSQKCEAADGTCKEQNFNNFFDCHDEEGMLSSRCLCGQVGRLIVVTADGGK